MQNPTGLAVGGIITAQGVTYVVLPGPPSELKPMVNQRTYSSSYRESLKSLFESPKILRRWRKSISDYSEGVYC